MYTIKLKRSTHSMTVKHVTRKVSLKHVGRRGPKGDQGDPGLNLVTSVHGRIGAVTSEDGDYTSDQITNSSDVLSGENVTEAIDGFASSVQQGFDSVIDSIANKADLSIVNAHISDITNPHAVTKAQVGLGLADNTSDLSKPISTATVAALAQKVSKGELVVNVMDYVTVVDGVTDNTTAFINAFSAGKTIIIPKQTQPYVVKYFAPPANKHIIGVGRPQINVQRNGATAISVVRSNSTVEGIYLNSLDSDLQFNRVGIESSTNVNLIDCKIEGFRHVSALPDAWGLYITDSTNVLIEDCQFENNSQSDIAIVDNCSQIQINRCGGSDFVLNFEPNGLDINSDISVSNSHISLLMLLESNFLVHSIDNVVFTNCAIDVMDYRGANVTFNDCTISAWRNIFLWGGKINNNNTYGYWENLNTDPYFHKIAPVGSDPKNSWVIHFSDASTSLDYRHTTTKGNFLQINPNSFTTTTSLARTLPVESFTVYSVRSLFDIFYPSGSVASNNFALEFYNSSNTIIGTRQTVCVDRKDTHSDTRSPWDEKEFFFQTPSGCAWVKIFISNMTLGSASTHKADFGYVLLNKVNLESKNAKGRNDLTTKYSTGPSEVALTPYIDGGAYQSLVGQKIYTTDPATLGYEGWLCVASGNPGTWEKFGILDLQTASTVANTPAGNIAATTVQAAINELDTEKLAKSGDTMSGALNTPAVALTSTTTGVASSANTGLTRLAGGTIGDGGVVLLGGSTNGSIPNQGILRISAANILTWLATGIDVADAKNISTGTTTGTKIGTSTSQKIAFWNGTPIVQPSTSTPAATRVGGGGTTLTDTDTFDGYTLAKVVKALRNAGILA